VAKSRKNNRERFGVSGGVVDAVLRNREIVAKDGRGYLGLGADASASVEVAWPSGAKQQFKNVPANQRVLIDENRGLSGLQ
jgi:hypothetical protein